MNLRWAPLGMHFNFHITRTIQEQPESASVSQGGTSPSTCSLQVRIASSSNSLAYLKMPTIKNFSENIFLGVHFPKQNTSLKPAGSSRASKPQLSGRTVNLLWQIASETVDPHSYPCADGATRPHGG